jgi:solute carrier family 25 S-adenosylmethionine transporter 26
MNKTLIIVRTSWWLICLLLIHSRICALQHQVTSRHHHPTPRKTNNYNFILRQSTSHQLTSSSSTAATLVLDNENHNESHDVVSAVDDDDVTFSSMISSTNSKVLQKRTLLIQSESRVPIWQLALAGTLATFVSDISMHPLDCIKTLQQSEEGTGLTMITAAQVIYTQLGGLAGFTKGFLTWGVCDGLGGALKFSTYEGLKRQVQNIINDDHNYVASDGTSSMSVALFALAALSFLASSIITVPGELLKQHLQMGHYDGCFDAVWDIVQTKGFAGLYTGYDGVLLRDVPYTAMELGLYDLFKTIYMSNQQKIHGMPTDYENTNDHPAHINSLQAPEQILLAGLTGGIAGLVTTPFDTIKTKMMVDMDYLGHSFWDCALLTIQEHGPGGLFCGALARVAWLVPVTAIYLPTYDYVKNKIHGKQEKLKLAKQ